MLKQGDGAGKDVLTGLSNGMDRHKSKDKVPSSKLRELVSMAAVVNKTNSFCLGSSFTQAQT